jgi:hypothetical protein
MGRYVPSLMFLNVLLGDEPVLPPHQQFYQRLLASEPEEARHVLETYRKERPIEELYDDVVIPALSMAEQDQSRQELDDGVKALMYQNIRDLLEEFGETPSEQPLPVGEDVSTISSNVEGGASDRMEILCIPARKEADDVVAFMLAQLLERRGSNARSMSMVAASELLSKAAGTMSHVVCISALPPFAMSHAREAYRSLRRVAPGMPIVIGLWHLEGDLQEISVRLKMNPGDALVSTLPEALVSVESALSARTHIQR